MDSIEELIKIDKNRPDNQIFVYDNIISDQNCDIIVKYINDQKLIEEKENWLETNVKAEMVSHKQKLSSNLIDFVADTISEVSNDMMLKYGIVIHGYEYFTLRKIYGPTVYHEDGNFGLNYKMGGSRVLAIIIALNGDYDGGELVFPCQNFTIKLKKGQCVLFPPYWTHPHYTNNLKNGTYRYTINTWLTRNFYSEKISQHINANRETNSECA
jgi:hypothetical protein